MGDKRRGADDEGRYGVGEGRNTARSSSKPPDDEEEPEDHYKEDDVPEPATALTGGHVVHAAKGTGEDAGRFGEGIVLDRTMQ